MADRFFRNLDGSGPQPFRNVLKWSLFDPIRGQRKRQPAGPPAPAVAAPADLRRAPAKGEPIRLTWLGHASWLVQADGVSLLIDPVLGKRIGGIIRRLGALPVGVEALPPIERTLVTHSHYDHLDLPTVRRVGAPVVTGLGLGRYLRGKVPFQELDWWDSTIVAGLKVTFVPSQHWSNRTPWDMNRSLWGGFVIESSGGAIYHSGDTAWFDGFKEIGRRFPRLSAALLPIGAYEPQWFMRRQHMHPEDAVNAFLDLGAKELLAMHWGTFQLTDEPIAEPAEVVRRLWRERRLPEERLRLLKIGETMALG